MLMIGANAGIVGMTKEHLGLALALSVPVFVVVTKIDMCPPNVLQARARFIKVHPGLPDFSWSKHTKMGKIYQMNRNYTKRL
jgi:selenocysteine-specific translation elongation factor